MLPNFLIAGAAKCGSYTLYHYLGKHPDILMSSVKEPAYFTKYYNKGLDFYENFFKDYKGENAIGEATVEYMVCPEAPERIYKTIPDIKLIFTLRNPIERASSHYWHRIKTGHENRKFDEVIKGGKNEYPIRYGLYFTQIKRFLKYFPLDKMHFIILERFSNDPISGLKEIFKFLEVNYNFSIRHDGPKNIAKIQRSMIAKNILDNIIRIRCAKKIIPERYKPFFRKFMKKLTEMNLREFKKPKLKQEHIILLYDYFYPEIVGLENILDYKLNEWKL